MLSLRLWTLICAKHFPIQKHNLIVMTIIWSRLSSSFCAKSARGKSATMPVCKWSVAQMQKTFQLHAFLNADWKELRRHIALACCTCIWLHVDLYYLYSLKLCQNYTTLYMEQQPTKPPQKKNKGSCMTLPQKSWLASWKTLAGPSNRFKLTAVLAQVWP